MEKLIAKLRAYSRQLELEDSIPYWEARKPELENRIADMDWNLRQKELEQLQWKEPNFFRRIFVKAEEKKETLGRQIREITAARMAAQWDLESLEKKIAEGKRELESLSGSREAYQQAKKAGQLTTAQESRLMMEEISAFAPVALETAWHILEALEEARPWMRRDAMRTGVGEGNRRMECLGKAETAARRLLELLEVLPEGVATIGSYLKAPNAYICGVTSEFKQLDRLELAQEQIRTVRNQLKQLLGE